MLLALVIAVSIGSYIFLSTVNPLEAKPKEENYSVQNEEDVERNEKVLFPDLGVIIKLIETGRKFIPASSF